MPPATCSTGSRISTIAYQAGAQITQIVSNTYYLDRTTEQVDALQRRTTTDIALVDDVVDLRFEYFGDPNPPLIPEADRRAWRTACTTPPATTSNLAGADADDGSLAELTAGDPDRRTVLRQRRQRVRCRSAPGPQGSRRRCAMQAASAALRGADTTLFTKPGKSAQAASASFPTTRVTFEVTPRNLNLAR